MTLTWLWERLSPVADAYVYKSNAYVSLKSTLLQMSSDMIDVTRPCTSKADERVQEAARLIRPMTADGVRLIRVGGNGDGGYLMHDDFDCVGALSIGVGKDVTWDQEISKRGIPVVLFDHTIKRLPSRVPNGKFIRLGIGPENVSDTRTLEELLVLSELPRNSDLLLKIDVEGAEWESLDALPPNALSAYRQILIEAHDFSYLVRENDGERILRVLRTISKTHIPVHVHANNYSDIFRFGNHWFPDAVEISYVRRDLFDVLTPATSVASDLDRPSDPRVPEYDLESLTRLSI